MPSNLSWGDRCEGKGYSSSVVSPDPSDEVDAACLPFPSACLEGPLATAGALNSMLGVLPACCCCCCGLEPHGEAGV